MVERKIRVLLVEDNPGDARLIQEFLSHAKMASFRIEVAERLSDGLAALSARGFDVVLLDLSLPDSSGLDTLTKVHSNAQQVAIIVLTGLSDEGLAIEAVRKGAQDYLVKGQIDENLLPRSILYAIERKRAEEVLQESEAGYRSVFENTGTATVIIEEDMTISMANTEFEKLSGYAKEEVEGKMKWTRFAVKEDLERMKEYHVKRRANEGNVPTEYEFRFIDRQGNIKDIFLKVGMLPGTKRTITSLLDITSRKQSEEALRESEEKFRTLAEQSPNIIFINKKGRVVYANEKCEEIMGYKRDEFYSSDFDFLTLIAPESVELVKSSFDKHMKGEEVESYECILITKDRKRIDAIITTKLMNYEGETAIFGIVTDISDLKRAQRELRESEERFRRLFEQSNDTVLIHKSGQIIDLNKRACEMLGYNKEQLLTMSISDLHPEKARQESIKRIDTARRGEAILFETQWRKADGTMVDVEVSSRVVDPENRIIQGIARDISERKQAEEERKSFEAQLAQAQKAEALGTLAGGIAHNFNNLLMAMMGSASLMLLETDPAHPNHERLKNIEKSVKNGSRLTRQLLGYAREGKYEIRPISLNHLVEETSDTFAMTKKEITVHRELAQDVCGIKADQGQIEQVLLNLYVNAADAMPNGGDLFLKTMNVTYKDMKNKPYKAKPGNYVLLTARDTGVGMDKKTMERIFDPFFTTKGFARGTGLGLASVYGIVKAHGGYIDVESKKGHGTTFCVYLPASEKRVEEPAKSAEKIIEGSGTILLVDDEEMVLDVGVQLLKALGYTVLEAKGGREAVEVYGENKDKIDMVLLDMIMPDMGGGDAYDRMKEINPNVKVLLSSGYSIDGQATEILERGCDGFIQKPFDMKQLSRGIREILDRT